MIVTIHVNDNLIGEVSPPTVNGKSIYVDAFQGKRNSSGEFVNVHDVIDELWCEWGETVKDPDCDSDFVEWLMSEKNWKEPPTYIVSHTIVT
jgi:hypothetical protein